MEVKAAANPSRWTCSSSLLLSSLSRLLLLLPGRSEDGTAHHYCACAAASSPEAGCLLPTYQYQYVLHGSIFGLAVSPNSILALAAGGDASSSISFFFYAPLLLSATTSYVEFCVCGAKVSALGCWRGCCGLRPALGPTSQPTAAATQRPPFCPTKLWVWKARRATAAAATGGEGKKSISASVATAHTGHRRHNVPQVY